MQLLDGLDALLITNPTNIRYLTGFVGAAPGEREAYVLLTPDQTFLFTNTLYREDAINLTQNSISFKRLNLVGSIASQGLTFIETSREDPFAMRLMEVIKRLNPATQGLTLKKIRLGYEEMNLTVSEYHKIMLELKKVTLVPTQNRIEALRMIKRDDEIENIRAAATITDQCFDFILGKLKESVTESQIAWEIESFIKTSGACLAFSPIVAFGPNSSQPHYSPSKNGALQPSKSNQSQALKLNDLVLLDFGAKVNGYCSDMTRTIFIGKPEAKWVETYNTVLVAQSVALEYLASRPGLERRGDTVDRMARDVIEKAGFPTYPHSLGHGVGLDIHEAPRLTVNPSTRSAHSGLQPGMVVTVEPGIYIEGQYGIRIEDLILLKEDGIEVLSKSNTQMMIL